MSHAERCENATTIREEKCQYVAWMLKKKFTLH